MGERKGPKKAKGAAPIGARRHVLYYGDNLDVLRQRMKDESVDLCYMDPPFNSKRNYNQIYKNVGDDRAQAQAFIDTWEWDDHARAAHRQILGNEDGRFPRELIALIRGLLGVLGEGSLFAYLVGMAARITEIRRVLKPAGAFYFHCDPTASHYIKLVCDAVFCSQGGNFQNEIIWQRTNTHSDSKKWSPVSDTLLFYSKSDDFTWNPVFAPHDEKYVAEKYRFQDSDGRRYMLDNMRSPSPRPNLTYDWKGHKPHRNGWAYSRETMEKLDREGRIWYPDSKEKKPRLKRYLDKSRGTVIGNVWTDIDPINSRAIERLGYPTQKPRALLERIIGASSNDGDVIFDPCCGCGTTIAAAQKLGRRWVGIDITYQSISLVLQRLEDQVGPEAWPELEGQIDLTGIPRDMESAVALAHKSDDRVRKEFEKWAILTYTNNRGAINDKKGADAGIDGRVYFVTGATESAMMVIQVKSGGVGRGDVAKLRGDMERENAALAMLITLEEATAPMVAEARSAGTYHHDLMDRDYDKIRVVTIKQIIEGGARIDLPLIKDLTKIAPQLKKAGENLSLFDQTGERKPPKAAERDASIALPAKKTSASKLKRASRMQTAIPPRPAARAV